MLIFEKQGIAFDLSDENKLQVDENKKLKKLEKFLKTV